MKIIENYCKQPRPYADSEGWLKIELEPGDDHEAIIKEYTKDDVEWWQESCVLVPSLCTETVLVFKKHQTFLD